MVAGNSDGYGVAYVRRVSPAVHVGTPRPYRTVIQKYGKVLAPRVNAYRSALYFGGYVNNRRIGNVTPRYQRFIV
jgi:hypothetical protein